MKIKIHAHWISFLRDLSRFLEKLEYLLAGNIWNGPQLGFQKIISHSIGAIISLSVSQSIAQEKHPDSFLEIPESLRQRATFVFSAVYSTARGRNEIIIDSIGQVSVWHPIGRLVVVKDYIGNLKKDLIEVEPGDLYRISDQSLIRGETYLILLAPSGENSAILWGNGSNYLILNEEEIIAIVKMKK